MIDRAHIDIFVDGLSRYFTHLDAAIGDRNSCLEIGAPYLVKTDQPLGLDFTGMILVSGNRDGTIFVSARSALLKRVLLGYGESDLSREIKRDLVGEMANTLAGNARRFLGGDFYISTPKVLEGPLEPSRFNLSSRCFVLPFRWRSNKAELIISLKAA